MLTDVLDLREERVTVDDIEPEKDAGRVTVAVPTLESVAPADCVAPAEADALCVSAAEAVLRADSLRAAEANAEADDDPVVDRFEEAVGEVVAGADRVGKADVETEELLDRVKVLLMVIVTVNDAVRVRLDEAVLLLDRVLDEVAVWEPDEVKVG